MVPGAQMATTVVERQQPRAAPPLLDQQPLTGVNDIPNANTCSFILQAWQRFATCHDLFFSDIRITFLVVGPKFCLAEGLAGPAAGKGQQPELWSQ